MRIGTVGEIIKHWNSSKNLYGSVFNRNIAQLPARVFQNIAIFFSLNKSIAFSPLICLGLIDNISDLLLHHLFLIAKRYIYTCKLNNCSLRYRFLYKPLWTPWKLKKGLPLIIIICPPSKTNGALLNFAPRTNKLAVIK